MSPRLKKFFPPLLYLVVTGILAGTLYQTFFVSDDRSAILPGVTTHGHYQIELQCDACHTDEKTKNIFTSSGVSNKSCNACHGEDLQHFSDSHPTRKFKNPENAVFLEDIDALSCVACHQEHNAKVTGEMALTVPTDYCAHCHQVTLENLDSHKDLKYDSCATAGCHNYHDNMPLAPGFLRKHFGEADVLKNPGTQETDALARWLNEGHAKREKLSAEEQDAPPEHSGDSSIVADWMRSAHSASGINCSDCHQGLNGAEWTVKPEPDSCKSCHGFEVDTFKKGKHGMRLAHENLSPMTPAMARQKMKAEAAHLTLDCSSCHQPHNYDRQFAAYKACIQCHDDEHTRGYESSSHFRLWQAELSDADKKNSGVSCATCHMPTIKVDGQPVVSHDQTANLTPNEKMLRSVCMNCHGLQFSMDALADESLILKNFNHAPRQRHPGITWAIESSVKRGDENIIQLKSWLEANPDKSRSDFDSLPDNNDTDRP